MIFCFYRQHFAHKHLFVFSIFTIEKQTQILFHTFMVKNSSCISKQHLKNSVQEYFYSKQIHYDSCCYSF